MVSLWEETQSGVAGEEANIDERDVIVEKEGPTAKEETQDEHVFPSREIKVEQGPAGEGVVTLRFKNSTELASLQSALSQLLQQVWTLKNKLVLFVNILK